MSVPKRKIAYWGLDFLAGDAHRFDPDVFCRFMTYIQGLNPERLLVRETSQNKAIALESIEETEIGEKHVYKVKFKSCKYNHSPNYMSSDDGSERETQKRMDEGEKEITHMCFRVDEDEAYSIFEGRGNGVSVKRVVYYLNSLLKDFIDESDDLEDNFYISAGAIPSEGFLESLDSASRVTTAELYMQKRVMGSGYLDVANEEINSREDIVVSVKSIPRESLRKRVIQEIYTRMTTEGTEVKRIRLYAKDNSNMNIIIDSMNGKKVDEVEVGLSQNGTVDSVSMFAKMLELLGEQ